MIKFPQHSCGDSRLSCSECEETVCPKCMVQCPVGNRCKKCASKTESHVLRVTPLVATKTFVAASLIGFGFSFISPFCGGWFYAWIIAYFIGVFLGNVLHRVASYKLGPSIVSVVIAGLTAGFVINPETFSSMDTNEASLQRLVEMDLADMEEASAAAEWKSKGKSGDKAASADKATSEETDAARAAKEARKQELRDRVIAQQKEVMKTRMQTNQFWHFVNLLIFAMGVLTPFTGIVPPFPFFPYRR